MQPNYEEERKKQQQDYQRSRNPFEYGQQVAQRRYSEIMAGLDAQSRATQQTYGDMYQAARQRAVGQQAMGGPTLSGGMGQQRRDFISALEMQELGRIGSQRQQAEADLYAQSQSAFANAELEGQQAAQMELQNRTAQLQLVQQRQAIMDDKNLTDEQKAQQLQALEGGESAETQVQATPQSFGNRFGDAALTGGSVLIAGGALVKTGAAALKAGTALSAAKASAALGGTALKFGAAVKIGSTAAGAGVLAKLGGGIAGALAAVPGWGWAAIAALAVGSLIYAAATS